MRAALTLNVPINAIQIDRPIRITGTVHFSPSYLRITIRRVAEKLLAIRV